MRCTFAPHIDITPTGSAVRGFKAECKFKKARCCPRWFEAKSPEIQRLNKVLFQGGRQKEGI